MTSVLTQKILPTVPLSASGAVKNRGFPAGPTVKL